MRYSEEYGQIAEIRLSAPALQDICVRYCDIVLPQSGKQQLISCVMELFLLRRGYISLSSLFEYHPVDSGREEIIERYRSEQPHKELRFVSHDRTEQEKYHNYHRECEYTAVFLFECGDQRIVQRYRTEQGRDHVPGGSGSEVKGHEEGRHSP